MPGPVGGQPGLHGSAFPCPSILLAGQHYSFARGKGMPSKKDMAAMPTHRTLGISLACLVTTACAMDEMPQESTSQYPDETADLRQQKAEVAPDAFRSFQPKAESCGGIPEDSCGLVRAAACGQRDRRCRTVRGSPRGNGLAVRTAGFQPPSRGNSRHCAALCRPSANRSPQLPATVTWVNLVGSWGCDSQSHIFIRCCGTAPMPVPFARRDGPTGCPPTPIVL
jgi:hypothetical protein